MTKRTPPRLERILVAVDFTDASERAATWVAQELARGIQIVLVHVIERPPMPRFLAKRYPATEQILESARAGAEAELRSMGHRIATGLVWPEVRIGKADEEAVRVAAEYGVELIVVGRTPTHPDGWGRVGTTAQRILRRSPVPVIVAGGSTSGAPMQPPSHLLAAVDDSPMADHVLRWAAYLAERFSIDGTALHVLSTPLFLGASALPGVLTTASSSSPPETTELEERAVGDARDWLSGRLRRSGSEGVLAPLVVTGGARPAPAIIDAARSRGASMIVMGSRGAGAADRLLFGSVAEAVLRDAPCPVCIVVAPPGRQRADRAQAPSVTAAT